MAKKKSAKKATTKKSSKKSATKSGGAKKGSKKSAPKKKGSKRTIASRIGGMMESAGEGIAAAARYVTPRGMMGSKSKGGK